VSAKNISTQGRGGMTEHTPKTTTKDQRITSKS